MQAVDPSPHLARLHADTLGKPRLTAAILLEDSLQWGLKAGTLHAGTDCTPPLYGLSSGVATSSMGTVPSQPRLIADALRELRVERGNMSRSTLSRRTVTVGYEGVPEGTIKALETIPGRLPSADILEALADALGVEPTTFYEYPVALARREAAEGPAGTVERESRGAAQRQQQRFDSTGSDKPSRRRGGGQR